MFRVASGSELKRDKTFINPFNGETTNPPTKSLGPNIKKENKPDTEGEETEGREEQEKTDE